MQASRDPEGWQGAGEGEFVPQGERGQRGAGGAEHGPARRARSCNMRLGKGQWSLVCSLPISAIS